MSLVGPGCPDLAAPYGSAYWGASAAHMRAREMVGAAESDPLLTSVRHVFAPQQSPLARSSDMFGRPQKV